MYYVNHEQLQRRLDFIPLLLTSCERLKSAYDAPRDKEQELLLSLAQERVLHLAIETVTDIGSLLIDAFMMRDASSYEDIVEVLSGENVFDPKTGDVLKRLVQLRKPLVQDYTEVDREGLHPLLSELPDALAAFAGDVPAFIRRELV